MKILDTVILIAILWFAFRGFRKGFVDGVFSLLAVIAGGWAMVHFSDTTYTWLRWEGENAHLAASGITFMGVIILVFMLGKIVKGVVTIILPEILDKLAGILLGGLKVLLFFGAIFHLIYSVDVTEKILTKEQKKASFFYQPSLSLADFLIPQIEKMKDIKIDGKKDVSNENIQCI